jgi:type III secretory pathway lipoprotein EscJ
VSFNWRDGGTLDVGLVAEDVAKIEPLLTTTNEKGQVEGVKYDRVGVVLVNAVKEQQAQIEAQSETIKRQQQQIDALTKLVCSTNADTAICATEIRKEK